MNFLKQVAVQNGAGVLHALSPNPFTQLCHCPKRSTHQIGGIEALAVGWGKRKFETFAVSSARQGNKIKMLSGTSQINKLCWIGV